MKLQLLSKGYTNAKLAKSTTESYILYMAPAALNCKGVNLCPASTAGCRAACLYTAGRGAMSNVQQARLRKADFFVNDRAGFIKQLIAELTYLNKRAVKSGKRIAVRLNGTTDVDWENLINLSLFQSLQFYDYTKRLGRAMQYGNGWTISNYHLTYSASEVTSDSTIAKLIGAGVNVAVVFSGKQLPVAHNGVRVISGDATDERWTDPKGVIIGLIAKGKAKKDQSGFVRQAQCHLRLVV